ncbi:hypothetical protein NPIL_591871 [Nephila pilipes]|uniref:Uncharacterized protein n=1 Tax=Nephila pilipes TaxID=299642 RepID=A0A8X6QU55_NEPPI|nr:hypothetical protein NPIL_591871 [Nephila pilipes]
MFWYKSTKSENIKLESRATQILHFNQDNISEEVYAGRIPSERPAEPFPSAYALVSPSVSHLSNLDRCSRMRKRQTIKRYDSKDKRFLRTVNFQ